MTDCNPCTISFQNKCFKLFCDLYILCNGVFKKALHSKIDVFVKFDESAINLEIRGQIKKKLYSFYLGHRDHRYAFSSKCGSEPFMALGDLTWNDPIMLHCEPFMALGDLTWNDPIMLHCKTLFSKKN